MLTSSGKALLQAVNIPEEVFFKACEANCLPPDMVLGIISRESGHPLAIRFEKNYRWTYRIQHFASLNGWSKDTEEALQKFSYGPMQVMGAVARERGFEGDLTNLRESLTGFCWAIAHLAYLHKVHTSPLDIVSTYNQGSPRKNVLTRKYLNQDYVDYVTRMARELYE